MSDATPVYTESGRPPFDQDDDDPATVWPEPTDDPETEPAHGDTTPQPELEPDEPEAS